MSDNYLHEIEREEARDAAMFATGPCYQHHYGRGLVCIYCGDELSPEEL